jgi:endonuclease/exonuclease/phosphatase (EEP) superfamily protein YafD
MTQSKGKVAENNRSHLVEPIVVLIGRLAVAATALSWFASFHWIADMLSHLRVQYAILLLPMLGVFTFRGKRWLAVAIVGLVIYNVWPTMPYFVAFSRSSIASLEQNQKYRVLTFNVLRTNQELELTLEEIIHQDADFVFLMEVQNAWTSYLSGVKDRYPYQKVLADPAYTGVAFLSKHPWESLDVVMLGEVRNPSIDVTIPCRGSLPGKLDRKIRIIGTHPLPPFGDMLTRSRDSQLKKLADRFIAEEPNLLVGDLNLSPWSPRFATILKAGSLVDASLGYGIETTLAPLPTWLGGVKVDHVLCDQSIRVLNYRVTSSANSDHKLVSVDFVVQCN